VSIAKDRTTFLIRSIKSFAVVKKKINSKFKKKKILKKNQQTCSTYGRKVTFLLSKFVWVSGFDWISVYIYIFRMGRKKGLCVCSKEVTFSISKAEIEYFLRRERDRAFKKRKTFGALVRLVLTVSQANDIPFILYTYYMIIYKKADVISTLGSHNTLIPSCTVPHPKWFSEPYVYWCRWWLTCLYSGEKYLFWQCRQIRPPRARPIFKFLPPFGHNKGRDITVRAYYEVSEKNDDEQRDIIRVVRGAALICFWPSSNPSEPRAAILFV
jgi:hypothetical protein